ncbi:MAG: TatD family hydrolase [Nitrospirales bacterium]|nr:MAG: TatD family hydrolase [Nitrospirales bacterium]
MIDFHTHLDLYPNPSEVARECRVRGMDILSVTTTPSAWKGTSAIAMPGSRVRTALGLHPQIAHQRRSELDLFDHYLPDASYVGEVGLDGAPEFKKYWDDQLSVFNHVLQACSRAGGRIMSIHSRRAASAVLDRLEVFPNAGVPILHWFSGNKRDLDRALSLNCWFSVGPAMLIGTKGLDLVGHIPREQILTETDGPFAQVNGRGMMPWDAQRAVVQLSALWKIPLKNVEQELDSNLQRFTSLL